MKCRNDDLAAYANGQRIAQSTAAWEGAGAVVAAEFAVMPGELYVHEDIMGSARRFTDGNGVAFGEIEYDVWGLPIVRAGENYEDILNPRYTNHTFDDVLGMYHAQFRFFDTKNKRFTQVDPVKDRLNWYGYCVANPITYTDPLGLALEIAGTNTEIDDVMKLLDQLSSDTIGQKGGVVGIATRVDDPGLPSGTELIRRLVDNEQFTATIEVTNWLEKGAFTFASLSGGTKYIFLKSKDELGSGSNSIIYFNPYMCEVSLPTKNPLTTLVSPQPTPNHISLAHELIHAERAMRGAELQDYKNFSYSYRVSREKFLGLWWNYQYETQKWSRDYSLRTELAVIGLENNSKGDITENMIRAEQPEVINPRGAY